MIELFDIRVAVNSNGPHDFRGRKGWARQLMGNMFCIEFEDGETRWLYATQLDFYWKRWTTRWVRFPDLPKVERQPPPVEVVHEPPPTITLYRSLPTQ